MSIGVRVFRYPRLTGLGLITLALLFSAGSALPPHTIKPVGIVFMSVIVVAMIVFGLMALRYRIVIDDEKISVTGWKLGSCKLVDAISIAVARSPKGSRHATVEFKDGSNLLLDNTLVGFVELLGLLSQRTSLPITKPVWDPNVV